MEYITRYLNEGFNKLYFTDPGDSMFAMFKEAYDGSYYTITGAGGDLQQWKDGYQELLTKEGIGTITKWIEFTGLDMNRLGRLSGDNAYPSSIKFLAFPLDNLDIGKLAIFKLHMQDRWFDDIIDNNARREEYHPFGGSHYDESFNTSNKMPLNEIYPDRLKVYVDRARKDFPKLISQFQLKLDKTTSKAEDLAVLADFWHKFTNKASDRWNDTSELFLDDSSMSPMPESVSKQFVNMLFNIKHLDILRDLDIQQGLWEFADAIDIGATYQDIIDFAKNELLIESLNEEKMTPDRQADSDALWAIAQGSKEDKMSDAAQRLYRKYDLYYSADDDAILPKEFNALQNYTKARLSKDPYAWNIYNDSVARYKISPWAPISNDDGLFKGEIPNYLYYGNKSERGLGTHPVRSANQYNVNVTKGDATQIGRKRFLRDQTQRSTRFIPYYNNRPSFKQDHLDVKNAPSERSRKIRAQKLKSREAYYTKQRRNNSYQAFERVVANDEMQVPINTFKRLKNDLSQNKAEASRFDRQYSNAQKEYNRTVKQIDTAKADNIKKRAEFQSKINKLLRRN